MSPSPVTVAYEYERPRFAYTVTVDGTETTVEGNYCLRWDGRFQVVEVTDIVADGVTLDPRTETVLDRPAAAVEGYDADRLGDDVWELQLIRPPSLLERLLPWRWPPDVEDPPLAEPADESALVHPSPDDLATCSGELLHSLDEVPPTE